MVSIPADEAVGQRICPSGPERRLLADPGLPGGQPPGGGSRASAPAHAPPGGPAPRIRARRYAGRPQQTYVAKNEPGSIMYTAWQRQDDPTSFVHLFEVRRRSSASRTGRQPRYAVSKPPTSQNWSTGPWPSPTTGRSPATARSPPASSAKPATSQRSSLSTGSGSVPALCSISRHR
jgi:hypothetical protein